MMLDLLLVEPIFRDIGIEPGWLYSLTYGNNEFYNNNTEILSYYYTKDEDGKEILIINSGSMDETKFSRGIMRKVLRLLIANKYVIVTSSNLGIAQHVFKKYNCIYNTELGAYIKVSEEE